MTAHTPAGPGATIEVEALTKCFGGRTATVALAPVDLHIASGEIVVLIGPSGCGKTTLLRTIGGLEHPTSGSVRIDGLDPDRARASRRIGFVPQSPALLPWRTVRRNVSLLRDANRPSDAAPMAASEIDELLAAVGLSDFASARPAQLSGGMQQRVGLVRAFALGAPILLMDEPFAALDEITRADMRRLLLTLWADRKPTIVFTTHSIEEAVLLADRVVVLSARPGRILCTQSIDLPRPRLEDIEDSEAFGRLARIVRASLRDALRTTAATQVPMTPLGTA